jgi:hypothetical protein
MGETESLSKLVMFYCIDAEELPALIWHLKADGPDYVWSKIQLNYMLNVWVTIHKTHILELKFLNHALILVIGFVTWRSSQNRKVRRNLERAVLFVYNVVSLRRTGWLSADLMI